MPWPVAHGHREVAETPTDPGSGAASSGDGLSVNGQPIVDLDLAPQLAPGAPNDLDHRAARSLGRHLALELYRHRHTRAHRRVNHGKNRMGR